MIASDATIYCHSILDVHMEQMISRGGGGWVFLSIEIRTVVVPLLVLVEEWVLRFIPQRKGVSAFWAQPIIPQGDPLCFPFIAFFFPFIYLLCTHSLIPPAWIFFSFEARAVRAAMETTHQRGN